MCLYSRLKIKEIRKYEEIQGVSLVNLLIYKCIVIHLCIWYTVQYLCIFYLCVIFTLVSSLCSMLVLLVIHLCSLKHIIQFIYVWFIYASNSFLGCQRVACTDSSTCNSSMFSVYDIFVQFIYVSNSLVGCQRVACAVQ